MTRFTFSYLTISLVTGSLLLSGCGDDHDEVVPTDDTRPTQQQIDREYDDAGRDIKDGAKTLGEGIKEGAKATGDAIERGMEKSGDALKDAADETGDALKDAAQTAKEKTGEATENIGEKLNEWGEDMQDDVALPAESAEQDMGK